MELSVRSHERHASPSPPQRVVLRLLLLVVFMVSSSLHAVDAAAELRSGQAQSAEISIGHSDIPCNAATPECDHKTHRNCTSEGGCQFAAMMPKAAMLLTDAMVGLLPLRSPFLKIGAPAFFFHPPKSYVQS